MALDTNPTDAPISSPGGADDDGGSVLDTIRSVVDGQLSRGSGDAAETGDDDGLATDGEGALRTRDANGRFAPKPDAPAPDAAAKPESAADPSAVASPPPTPAAAPPPGFSVQSKQAWAQLPEHVRADVLKREQEFSAGMRRYTGLGKYAEAAEKNGRSLGQAVEDYAQAETALLANPIGGIEYICDRMGFDPALVAQGLAAKHLGIHPSTLEALKSGQPDGGAALPQAAPALDPNQVASHVYGLVQAQMEEARIGDEIATFASNPSNRFFENVRPVMVALIAGGQAADLKQAYEAACWMNPETRAVLINEQAQTGAKKETAAVARAQSAAKAVGGAPDGGINADSGQALPDNASVMDTIKFAVARQGGV